MRVYWVRLSRGQPYWIIIMDNLTKHWLYTGQVVHKRIGHAAHQFVYPALFICFPLESRKQLSNRLCSYNRFNVLSFHEKDYGNGVDAQAWIDDVLTRHDLADIANGQVWLQTQPRVLGYVFNPVNFWYCHDQQQQLRAIVCEVNNTFGERHCYLLTHAQHEVINNHSVLQCQKVFHVSPFFAVEGEYQFKFIKHGQTRSVAINYFVNQQLQLKTVVTGRAQALTATNILRSLTKLGWTTVNVVLGIHWQAFKLWRKGAIFHSKPQSPRMEISS